MLTVDLDSEAATARFAEDLALALKPGDVVLLSGDLGAGKSFLARALIRAAADDSMLEVPSPTFTLVQSYDGLPFGTLAHMDLYRLEDPAELEELGLEDARGTGVVLIEWPEKGGLHEANADLFLTFDVTGEESRTLSISGRDGPMGRLRRSLAIRDFLDREVAGDATRRFLTGDASTRAYETVSAPGTEPRILMNAPAQPDGPPIRDGKPYSQIARLAENMRAFVGVQQIIEKAGFRVPRIDAADLDDGLLLIENLGSGLVIDEKRRPIPERYEAAIDMLAAMHVKGTATSAVLPDGSTHTVPPYDAQAMEIEVDLLLQWYAPRAFGSPLSEEQQRRFHALWSVLFQQAIAGEQRLVLRDFHSPNIIWRGDAKRHDRIGLIDFQDALIGPSAYDVASLALDARVDVPVDLERSLLDRYIAARNAAGDFDESGFRAAYAIMGAQRITKILGIFVRLSQRDGKHGYLAHLPRMEDYLQRTLAHPALAELKNWVDETMPLKGKA